MKWQNLRRAYTKFGKKLETDHDSSTHYLFNELSFFLNYIKHKDTSEKTENIEDTEDNLTFNDVKHLCNLNTEDKFEKQKEKRNDDKECNNSKSNNQIPTPSISYNKKKQKIDEVEQLVLATANKAMDSIDIIMNNTSQKEDCYLDPIDKALSLLPENKVLSCVNGILSIIDTLIN